MATALLPYSSADNSALDPNNLKYDFDTGEAEIGYWAPPRAPNGTDYILDTEKGSAAPTQGNGSPWQGARYEDGVGWVLDGQQWHNQTGATNKAAGQALEEHNSSGVRGILNDYAVLIAAAPFAAGIAGAAAGGAGAAGAGNSLGGSLASAGAVDGALAGGAGAGVFNAAGLDAAGGLGYEGAGELVNAGGDGGYADDPSAITYENLIAQGLDPTTVGEFFQPFTTDPALAELGGAGEFSTGFSPSTTFNNFASGTAEDAGITDAQLEANRAANATGMTTPNIPPGTTTLGEKLLKKLTDNPLTAAALAANLASASAQKKSAGTQADKLNQVAAPVSGVANDLLAQYKSGTLNAGDAFDINTWEQQQLAKAKNYFAKAGMTNSSSANHTISQIQAQATAMREKARQGLLTSGLQASQISYGPMRDAIQAQANQDQAFSQSQAQALNALMLLQAMQARQAGAAT